MSLPPSALAVLDLLAARGPLTHKQLVQAAHLPPRTLRFALKRLNDANRLVERPNFRDLRQAYYALRAPDASAAAVKTDLTAPFMTAEA